MQVRRQSQLRMPALILRRRTPPPGTSPKAWRLSRAVLRRAVRDAHGAARGRSGPLPDPRRRERRSRLHGNVDPCPAGADRKGRERVHAAEPAALAGLMPSREGRVLPTARTAAWKEQAHAVVLEPFGPRESADLLLGQVPCPGPVGAGDLAGALGLVRVREGEPRLGWPGPRR
jgi:hypothetical protein